jgi:hypothetical protein
MRDLLAFAVARELLIDEGMSEIWRAANAAR